MTGFGDFVLAQLPPTPARVLEIGCGDEGGVVELLVANGYDAIGVDPRAPAGERFHREPFEVAVPRLGTFDAVVAGRVLHHVEPLAAGLDVLAAAAPLLLVDEFAWDEIDEPAKRWYHDRYAELRAVGVDPHAPEDLDEWRWRHPGLHDTPALRSALEERYEQVVLERGPYLHRWLGPETEPDERALVEAGEIPAIGWHWAGTVATTL